MDGTAGGFEQTEICTIGYEKTDIGSFIARLVAAEIDVLVDVRELPLSRKKGFSKNGLKAAAEGAGLAYVHVKALGDPKAGRDAARAGDYEKFERIFTAHMDSNDAKFALEDLAESIKGRRICLTCFERSHSVCHRSIVAKRLSSLTGAPVQHIAV